MQTRPDNPALASTTYQLVSVDGVENFAQGTLEGVSASLISDVSDEPQLTRHAVQSADIEYTRGVATNVPVTYVSMGGGSSLADNLAMINFLIQRDPAPLVLTTSYAFQETFTGSNQDLAMLVNLILMRARVTLAHILPSQLCNAYAQLGARGTSVLFSSGDSGVAGNAFRNPQCLPGNVFLPSYPASCPL